MIVVVGQMREISLARTDTPRRGEGLIEAHVCRMRCAPERIQYHHVHLPNLLNDWRGHLLAVTQICQSLIACLNEKEP